MLNGCCRMAAFLPAGTDALLCGHATNWKLPKGAYVAMRNNGSLDLAFVEPSHPITRQSDPEKPFWLGMPAVGSQVGHIPVDFPAVRA